MNIFRTAQYLGMLLAGLISLPFAQADQGSMRAPGGFNNSAPVSASARLDFNIFIEKYIFLGIGSGAGSFSTTSNTVDTLKFNTRYDMPTTPSDGNSQTYSWDGKAPVLSANTIILPVAVSSNAGQVSVRASSNGPLSSGALTIPLSDIEIESSDTAFPAPVLPASGSSNSVNVAGTAFGGLVTERQAEWAFSYEPSTPPAAGEYQGEIVFTASAP